MEQVMDAKTEKILHAAEALFLSRGLRATTMEAIAKEAGVAKPTLYGRFADKETVFRAVVGAVIARLQGAFSAGLAGKGSPVDRVANALAAKHEALHALLSSSPHAVEILEANEALAGAENAARYDWTLEEVTACLTEARVDAARDRARLVLAACEGVQLRAGASASVADDVRFIVERLLG